MLGSEGELLTLQSAFDSRLQDIGHQNPTAPQRRCISDKPFFLYGTVPIILQTVALVPDLQSGGSRGYFSVASVQKLKTPTAWSCGASRTEVDNSEA